MRLSKGDVAANGGAYSGQHISFSAMAGDGYMAADILEGKSKPANMPIQFAKVLKAMFNKTDAAKLGITLSDDLLKDADVVE